MKIASSMNKIPRVVEVVRSLEVKFRYIVDDPQIGHNMWYSVDVTLDDGTFMEGWEFPVPVRETLGATFLSTDKPMFFMRWIRRQIILLNDRAQAQTAWEQNLEDV